MNFRKALSILLFFLTLAGIHLYFYTQNIQLKYQVTELKIKLSEIMSRNREKAAILAKEENLGRVEKIAREKLGMIYPEKIKFIILSSQESGKNLATPELN